MGGEQSRDAEPKSSGTDKKQGNANTPPGQSPSKTEEFSVRQTEQKHSPSSKHDKAEGRTDSHPSDKKRPDTLIKKSDENPSDQNQPESVTQLKGAANSPEVDTNSWHVEMNPHPDNSSSVCVTGRSELTTYRPPSGKRYFFETEAQRMESLLKSLKSKDYEYFKAILPQVFRFDTEENVYSNIAIVLQEAQNLEYKEFVYAMIDKYEYFFHNIFEHMRLEDKRKSLHWICKSGNPTAIESVAQRWSESKLTEDDILQGLKANVEGDHISIDLFDTIIKLKNSFNTDIHRILYSAVAHIVTGPETENFLLKLVSRHVDSMSIFIASMVFDFASDHAYHDVINLSDLCKKVHWYSIRRMITQQPIEKYRHRKVASILNKTDYQPQLLNVESENRKWSKNPILYGISQAYDLRYPHHLSEVESHALDLSYDKRLQYSSRCVYFSHSLSHDLFAECSQNVLPCTTCTRQLHATAITSYRMLAELSTVLRSDECSPSSLKSAIERDNIFVAIKSSKFLFYALDILRRKEERNHLSIPMSLLLGKRFKEQFRAHFSQYFDFVHGFLALDSMSQSLIIVALYYGHVLDRVPFSFMGIRIIWKSMLEMAKPEHYQSSVGPTIDSSTAERLFKNHSNLNIISPSSKKQIRNTLCNGQCIVLYCWSKDFIPVGEQKFPKVINGLMTDVREGFCMFGSGDKVMKNGEQIGTMRGQNVTSTGTLGGFVEKNTTTYALTCSHVLMTPEEIENPNIRPYGKSVKNISTQSNVGAISEIMFNSGDANAVSVDAALVKLDANVSISESFPDIHHIQLRKLGFDRPPKFPYGETASVHDVELNRNTVIKYGAVTELTKGSLRLDGTHVRLENIPMSITLDVSEASVSDVVTPSQMEFTDPAMNVDMDTRSSSQTRFNRSKHKSYYMYNQAEIDSHSSCANLVDLSAHHTCTPFFKPGDSGSLVFVVMNDNSLKCVGMAIGCTSYGSCIMTPIQDILMALDTHLDPQHLNPPIKLKPIVMEARVPDTMSNNSSTDGSGHLQMSSDLSVVLSALSALQSDIRTMDSRIDTRFVTIENKMDLLENKMDRITVDDEDEDL